MKAPWAFSSRSPRCTGRSRDPNAKIGKLRHIGGSHLVPAPPAARGPQQVWGRQPGLASRPSEPQGAPKGLWGSQ